MNQRYTHCRARLILFFRKGVPAGVVFCIMNECCLLLTDDPACQPFIQHSPHDQGRFVAVQVTHEEDVIPVDRAVAVQEHADFGRTHRL